VVDSREKDSDQTANRNRSKRHPSDNKRGRGVVITSARVDTDGKRGLVNKNGGGRHAGTFWYVVG